MLPPSYSRRAGDLTSSEFRVNPDPSCAPVNPLGPACVRVLFVVLRFLAGRSEGPVIAPCSGLALGSVSIDFLSIVFWRFSFGPGNFLI